MLHRKIELLICLLVLALAGCASRDTQAADAASEAQAALQMGRNTDALRSIHKALEARDDVSEYWLLLGRIDTATDDLTGAFSAYENALGLDHGNVEALRLLCQLGLTVRAPDKVDKYADQLLLMNPGDTMPLVMKGRAALERDDPTTALQFAEQVLAKAPQDNDALILKGQVMAARKDFAGAAKFIEGAAISEGDEAPRLLFLKDLYSQAHDRPHYQWTLQRLAAAKADDPAIQLDYADMLYQTGQTIAANTVITRIMRLRPNDIGVAANILDIWLKQGPDVLSLPQIPIQAANVSMEMQAAYAQFANEIGHPEIAKAILEQRLTDSSVTIANADAKAALAYAIGLQGHRADAISRLSDVLEFDPSQPRALLDRARLRSADKDFTGATEDARHAIAQDPRNATARMALADILFANGEAGLAESTLREGVRAMPEDCRLAARLAKFLLQQGKREQANSLLRDLTRATPVSLRASRLRLALDPGAKIDTNSE